MRKLKKWLMTAEILTAQRFPTILRSDFESRKNTRKHFVDG